AFFILANTFIGAMVMNRPDKMRYAVLAAPILVSDGATRWVFDTTSVRAPKDSNANYDIVQTRNGTVRRFRRRQGPVETADLPGDLYGLAVLGFLAIGGTVLAVRYRSIET